METATEPSVLTPDFYDYDWEPPASATVLDRVVRVVWDDGVALDAFDLWLYENAVGAGGVDAATREGLIDPGLHDLSRRVEEAVVADDGALTVTFSAGGGVARFHPGWLRHVAQERHRPTSWLPAPVRWEANDLGEPPTHDGVAALADSGAFADWLNDLVTYGLARLRGLPDDADVALAVGTRIGAVRDTNFGPIWDVKADIQLAGSADTNSTANTNLRLGPHTDLPTRETPPGFQFLHCYRNEARGGNSTMADGAAVVAALEAEQPQHHEALTTLNWIFFNRGPGIDHRWSGPMIDLGVAGSPLTLRAFYPVRAFPDMDPADMPRAYEAMQVFSQMAASSRFQISYPFVAGDLVGFDNRRILHGRDPFAAGGKRHLRGIYIDHDEVLSTTRVANRRARTNKEATNG